LLKQIFVIALLISITTFDLNSCGHLEGHAENYLESKDMDKKYQSLIMMHCPPIIEEYNRELRNSENDNYVKSDSLILEVLLNAIVLSETIDDECLYDLALKNFFIFNPGQYSPASIMPSETDKFITAMRKTVMEKFGIHTEEFMNELEHTYNQQVAKSYLECDQLEPEFRRMKEMIERDK
jgi:hypothetical protein